MANRKLKNRDEDALYFAIDAHQNHFSSHRGTWPIDGKDQIVLYDNHPWANHPTLRAEQMERLRVALEGHGILVVGEAVFPAADAAESAGYTLAWISHDLTTVQEEWKTTIAWAIEEIGRRGAEAKRPHLRLVD